MSCAAPSAPQFVTDKYCVGTLYGGAPRCRVGFLPAFQERHMHVNVNVVVIKEMWGPLICSLALIDHEVHAIVHVFLNSIL